MLHSSGFRVQGCTGGSKSSSYLSSRLQPFSGTVAAAHKAAWRGRAACGVRATQAGSSDFGESVKRIAKKIQGSLPVIGLLSRLASPEGGFDEIAYPEFCRTVYDKATPQYFEAVTGLEKAYGKPATHRALLMVLWLAKFGPGIVPLKDIVAAARRVRVSQDIEVEMERFEGVREVTLKKYNMMERPAAKLSDQVEVAVDGLAALVLGLSDGKEVPAEDAGRLAVIVSFVFPEAGEERVREVVASRAQRSYS